MYERPELKFAHQKLWSLIRRELVKEKINAPKNLLTGINGKEVWRNNKLLFSQTCSLPFRNELSNHVTYLATPVYSLEDCPEGYYRSVFLVNIKNKDLKISNFLDKVFACNSLNSQSGYAAPYNHIAEKCGWFSKKVLTGSHRNSVIMVANGNADITCIDELSWKIIKCFDGFSKNLIVLEKTIPTPALPYITISASDYSETIYKCLSSAFEQLQERFKKILKIKTVIKVPLDEYLKIPNPPQ